MSSRRITIIQGHPDIEESHLGHALALSLIHISEPTRPY